METRRFADSVLWGMACPPLASLLLAAPPERLRHFAFAGIRLGVSTAPLEGPIVDEAMEVAARILRGACETADSRAVAAREAAWEWKRRLDDRQLTIHEEIEADLGDDATGSHPRRDEHFAAVRRFWTANALAYLLHDDPLEAAVQCAYALQAGLLIDDATLLAIGRDTVR